MFGLGAVLAASRGHPAPWLTALGVIAELSLLSSFESFELLHLHNKANTTFSFLPGEAKANWQGVFTRRLGKCSVSYIMHSPQAEPWLAALGVIAELSLLALFESFELLHLHNEANTTNREYLINFVTPASGVRYSTRGPTRGSHFRGSTPGELLPFCSYITRGLVILDRTLCASPVTCSSRHLTSQLFTPK